MSQESRTRVEEAMSSSGNKEVQKWKVTWQMIQRTGGTWTEREKGLGHGLVINMVEVW